MTHLIKHWQRPAQIAAFQTSRVFKDDNCFDIHPNHTSAQTVISLVSEFNLPHAPTFMLQEHGNTITEYLEPPKKHLSVISDACFTRIPNVICAVMTADCLPVLMTDVDGSFVAAVHCGWRSLYANILTKTLEAINPQKEVLIWFGPCIQQNQYEVDDSFVTHYLKQHPDSSNAFTDSVNNKSQASLYQMAETQLNSFGVSHINKSNQCTYLNKNYFSWRENATPHRMSTAAWIKQ